MGDFFQTDRGKEIMDRIIQGNENRAKIQPVVYPLALRRFPVDEIIFITGFSRQQVESAIRIFREKGEKGKKRGLERPTGEEISAAIVRANTGRREGKPREHIIGQLSAFAFARKLIEDGLITGDLADWNGLYELYTKNRRSLPEGFSDRLRLEGFFAAHRNGDQVLLAKYKEIGDNIDSRWFDTSLADDEDFIAVHAGVFGGREDIGEDKNGLYHVDEFGRRWRTPVQENGVIVFDDSKLAAERAESRERVEGFSATQRR